MNISGFGGFGFKKIWGGAQSFGFRRINAGFQQKKIWGDQASFKNQFRQRLKSQIYDSITATSINLTSVLSPVGQDAFQQSMIRIRALQDAYLRKNPEQLERLQRQNAEAAAQSRNQDSGKVIKSLSRGSEVDEEA